MAKYTIEIDVDEGQDKYLKDKASTYPLGTLRIGRDFVSTTR